MDWLTPIIIGILQGTTEWLPISSSGQSTLVLVDGFGISAATAISLGLAIHVGTALAVVVKYPKQLLQMADPMKSQIAKNYWLVTIVSLIVAFPLILLLKETFDNDLWTGTTITIFIGLALIATGLMLRRSPKRSVKKLRTGGLNDWVLLGIVQGFAVLPGISRSGTTVSTLLIRGYEKTKSLQFSFLLSVPVSIAATVYLWLFGDLAEIELFFFVLAAAFAFVFGYLTMGVLIKISRKINFSKFCIFFGGLAVVIALIFWLLV